MLVALNELWGTRLSRADLIDLGLKLGADVPVFVFGESAFAEGIGEVLTPLALPPAWYVVLTPPVAVATARVFAHPDLKRHSKTIKIQGFSAGGLLKNAVNDLESLVCRLYPGSRASPGLVAAAWPGAHDRLGVGRVCDVRQRAGRARGPGAVARDDDGIRRTRIGSPSFAGAVGLKR